MRFSSYSNSIVGKDEESAKAIRTTREEGALLGILPDDDTWELQSAFSYPGSSEDEGTQKFHTSHNETEIQSAIPVSEETHHEKLEAGKEMADNKVIAKTSAGMYSIPNLVIYLTHIWCSSSRCSFGRNSTQQ